MLGEVIKAPTQNLQAMTGVLIYLVEREEEVGGGREYAH